MITFDSDIRTNIEGKPLFGRVHFYQLGTNVHDTIYTYNVNQELIEIANPQYTNQEGYIVTPVILDEKAYSIVQETYLGDYEDPSSDTRPEMWAVDRQYIAGSSHEQTSTLNETVYGLTALRSLVPSMDHQVVNVIGYRSVDDCPMRQYMWFASTAATDNGGTVIASDTENGVWYLITNLPYMPSEYFGVYYNQLSNMNNLCNYSEVGGDNITYPSTIKFARGYYNLTAHIRTNHGIICEHYTKFGNFDVYCSDFRFEGDMVTGDEGYVGNIYPKRGTVYTNWYRTASGIVSTENHAERLVVNGFVGTNDLTSDRGVLMPEVVFLDDTAYQLPTHVLATNSVKISKGSNALIAPTIKATTSLLSETTVRCNDGFVTNGNYTTSQEYSSIGPLFLNMYNQGRDRHFTVTYNSTTRSFDVDFTGSLNMTGTLTASQANLGTLNVTTINTTGTGAASRSLFSEIKTPKLVIGAAGAVDADSAIVTLDSNKRINLTKGLYINYPTATCNLGYDILKIADRRLRPMVMCINDDTTIPLYSFAGGQNPGDGQFGIGDILILINMSGSKVTVDYNMDGDGDTYGVDIGKTQMGMFISDGILSWKCMRSPSDAK